MDWTRLHAALNDLPAALLLMAVLFDLAGAVTKRESLKAAGFWCLITGVLGTGMAIGSGLLAEGTQEHSDRAHAVMETHETLAIIVLVLFGALALWRLARRGVLGDREQTIASTAGVIGVALMVVTAKLGGSLVFEHGLGIGSAAMEAIQQERAADRGTTHEHAVPADSATGPGDTAQAAPGDSVPHTHSADSARP